MQKVLFATLFLLLTPFTHFVSAEETDSGSVYEMYHSKDNSANQNDEGQSQPSLKEGTDTTNLSPEEEVAFVQNETSFFMIIVQMMGALVVVISLIYILLRFVNKRTRSFQSHKTMQHVGGVPLGANRSVQMVKVGDQLFILGVGETIQLIKEISDKEEIGRLLENQEQEMMKMEEPILKFSKWVSAKVLHKDKQLSKNEFAFKELLNRQLKDVSASQEKVRKAMKEHKDE